MSSSADVSRSLYPPARDAGPDDTGDVRAWSGVVFRKGVTEVIHLEAEIMEVEISRIVIGPNRRELDMSFVKELARSIDESGLIHPITVNKEFTLIAGLHRLEAVKMLGHRKIRCTMMDLNGLQAEMAEIDENFVRNPLDESEKCEILLRRKKIYEELHPEAKKGGDRKSEKIKAAQRRFDSETVKSFTADTAEKLGISKTAVERRVRVAEKVTPEAKKVFEGAEKKFSLSEGLKLSRIAPEHQKEAAEQYIDGKITSISDYQAGVNPPVKAQPTKRQRSGKSPPTRAVRQDAGNEPRPSARTAEPESAPLSPENPVRETRKPPTFQELVADLKDSDRNRPLKVEMFVSEYESAFDDLVDHIDWFGMQDYLDIFPELSKEQYQVLCDKKQSVQARIEQFLELVRGKMHT